MAREPQTPAGHLRFHGHIPQPSSARGVKKISSTSLAHAMGYFSFQLLLEVISNDKGGTLSTHYMLGFVCNIPANICSPTFIITSVLQTRKVKIREP